MKNKDTERIELKDFTANLSADIPARSMVAYITTDTVDEEGESILSRGIQTTRFIKGGGICFWNHNYDDPVGVCAWLAVNDKGIVASTKFPERPEGHKGEWRPDAVLSLVAAGLCRGVSIGFSYIETRDPTTKDKQQFKSTGNELLRVVSKSRLLEYSLGPLPMNEDALVVAARRGFINCDGEIDCNAVKACRFDLEGRNPSGSVILKPSGSLKLRSIDPASLTLLEIERLQGRVY